jgi:hypothetical protein
MSWFLLWLMIFSTSSDPSPARPEFGLSVNGVRLSEDRFAFIAMPGESIRLSSGSGPLSWSVDCGAEPAYDASDYSFTLPRSHGMYTLRAGNGDYTESYYIIVPVESSRWRTVSLNSFPIGSYGDDFTRNHDPDYFIELTPERSGARISTHLTLGEFLCHHEGPYPQYMALDLRLADKLEVMLSAVRETYPEASSIHLMSAFRTPLYNAEIGNETSFSQHLYGGAADVWIEGYPANALMDDVDRNKRVDVYDGEYLVDLVRVLEAMGEVAVGGASAYRWTGTHGPFVHVDVRGSAAFWQTQRNLVPDPVI